MAAQTPQTFKAAHQHIWQLGRFLLFSSFPSGKLQAPQGIRQYVHALMKLQTHRTQFRSSHESVVRESTARRQLLHRISSKKEDYPMSPISPAVDTTDGARTGLVSSRRSGSPESVIEESLPNQLLRLQQPVQHLRLMSTSALPPSDTVRKFVSFCRYSAASRAPAPGELAATKVSIALQSFSSRSSGTGMKVAW